MADRFDALSAQHQRFIERQKLFFVATAAADGHVNLSPKGQDSLRVVGPREILWLNLTGSGNETAAHVAAVNRMTLMWCAFDGPPEIMRVYGSATVVHRNHPDWSGCAAQLPEVPGTRQYFRLAIDLVTTSCGYAVPRFDWVEDRRALTLWTDKRGPEGIRDYWRERNASSLDGLPTGIEANLDPD